MLGPGDTKMSYGKVSQIDHGTEMSEEEQSVSWD